jgi:tetrahydromethanopterin S-methyltransferase subunit G
MSMNVEAEIRDLKRRVSELEGSFGFLAEQIKGVHRSLLGFQERTEERFDGIDGRLDGIDGRLDKVEGEVRAVKTDVRALRKDMPKIVGDAIREVMRPGER